ncbi:PEP-CTERM/exosortase system-associated acyltransferase [uncultured Paraglaciecola sp.]|uniref:PEP-CTERM/exosortase system-associated acyltransferase n=1 Tax=uncultured Paraglaciecola sp. TaxID=1765024 RepID=UPI0030DB326A|tara:strand:- start:73848 stop:74642 length:795 start_codon:yes stop_codon:yes gene_type:complete
MQSKSVWEQSSNKTKSATVSDLFQLSPLHRFGRYFWVESGVNHMMSPTKCDEIYRLRHKVYCEKMGYEPVNNTGIETDDFDTRAHHVAITHQKLGDVIGCTRVVNCYHQDDLLPMEVLAQNQLLDSDYHPEKFGRDNICEISRLAVDQEFKQNLHQETSEQEQKLYPYIALHLYYTSLKLAAESNRPHVYLLSESKLIRSMRLVGINIIPIGDYVAHKGLRKPCYINAQEFIDNLPRKFMPMSQNEYSRNPLTAAPRTLSVVNA